MKVLSKVTSLSRRQILFPVAILFSTLVTNGIILTLCSYNPWEAMQVAVVGAFGDGRRITETLVKSVPFLFTGLAVAFSFRCGIWNIGAEGQFLLGAIASTWCGTQLAPHLPPTLAIPLTLLVGAMAGGIWALIAALLKVYRGVQEVISTIMLNYVAIYLLSYMVDGGPLQEAAKRGPQSDMIAAASYLPRLIPQTRFHLGLPLAIALAIILSIVLFRTVLGYQIRAVGANPKAAQAAGISISKNVILALFISGSLAGLGGAIELTALTRRLFLNFSPGYGYTAIAVALLVKLHPLWVIVSSLLFGALKTGSDAMQQTAGISAKMTFVIQATIIFFVLIYGVSGFRAYRRKTDVE